jgi:hypothetical protein
VIHWLPTQLLQRGAAEAVSGWSGAAAAPVAKDGPALLDAVIAVAKDSSGRADAAVDQVVRRVGAA